MATISIADNDARIQHSIGGSANTPNVTPYPIDFPFFDLDDIDVTITDSSGVDTALDRGTGANTFAVTGTVVDDGYSAGNITLGTAYTNVTITISRDVPIERTSDFATSGPFNISSLNTDLDKIYAVMQQLETNNARTLSLPVTDTLNSITLPSNTSRRGKYLAFNETTGDAEIGGNVADTGTVANISSDITTLADISTDITTVAHLEDGTTATNAISNLGPISTAISGVNSISTEVQQVYADRVAIQNASANATLAENYATKIDGAVETSPDTYSSKAWAIGGTGINDVNGAGSAKAWATEADLVDGLDHSSKTHAISGSTLDGGSAMYWEIGGTDSFDSNQTIGTTGLYSAKYYAEQAAASKTEFSNIYHGAAATDPTEDPDTSALEAGDLYFNTTSNVLKYYDGSAWNNIEATDTSSFAGQGFAVAMAIAL